MRVLDEINLKKTTIWLCLGLVNTVENRNEEIWDDQLVDIALLVEGLRDRGFLAAEEHDAIVAELQANPDVAAALLTETKELRETLFQVFSTIAAEREPAAAQMDALNARISEVYSHLEVTLDGDSVHWGWRDAEGRLDSILWPVVHSAAQLLTSPELSRLRNCDGDKCTFLFLDRSKNRSRRWCTMDVCGNRAKSKRHYARTKAN